MSSYALFTSESVSEGHPDKVSDQVSDAILDLYLAKDPNARVAVETLVKTGMAVVAGEVTSSATVTPGKLKAQFGKSFAILATTARTSVLMAIPVP